MPHALSRAFERATIQFSARWKVRSPEGTFVYKGDVQADDVKVCYPHIHPPGSHPSPLAI